MKAELLLTERKNTDDDHRFGIDGRFGQHQWLERFPCLTREEAELIIRCQRDDD